MTNTLTFLAGVGRQRRCACVQILQDVEDDDDEQFLVTINTTSPDVFISRNTSTVTIVDDDRKKISNTTIRCTMHTNPTFVYSALHAYVRGLAKTQCVCDWHKISRVHYNQKKIQHKIILHASGLLTDYTKHKKGI